MILTGESRISYKETNPSATSPISNLKWTVPRWTSALSRWEAGEYPSEPCYDHVKHELDSKQIFRYQDYVEYVISEGEECSFFRSI